MYPRIELIWLSETAPLVRWTRGPVSRAAPTPWAVARLIERRLPASDADGYLFWDPALGPPDPARVAAIFQSRGDVWHAGLRLGMAGKPALIDFVAPAWPLNRDPGADTKAPSWRLSLRACLVQTRVIRTLGGPDAKFESLEMAGLEMGHRYIRLGAIPRHVPSLIEGCVSASTAGSSLADQLRFLSLGYGRFWAAWALLRSLLTGDTSAREAFWGGRTLRKLPAPPSIEPLKMTSVRAEPAGGPATVSVILPTLDRYPYLRRLLQQLRAQTAPAGEIIIVDQTPHERRELLGEEFPDLPLRIVFRDHPGQCSARNAAISAAKGEYLLFLDDDDEVPADLIESHLRFLRATGADASCGVVDEACGSSLAPAFGNFRVSDVFPTGNAMLRREALRKSGLFDLAYDCGAVEDADLGMRLSLSGAVLLLNPAIRVLHHHAPRGGLRAHGARVITYAMSRQSIWKRRLPSPSEIYYLKRYFTPRQVRESLWLMAFGTSAIRGSLWKKVGKVVIAALQFPSTLLRIRRAATCTEDLARAFPEIPKLPTQPKRQSEDDFWRNAELSRAASA